MKKLFVVAAAAVTFAAGSVHAEVISNPYASNSGGAEPKLCGWPYQGGGCQTVFAGESFGVSETGSLTNLQFTLLGGSTLTSVQAIVYALNGPLSTTFIPGSELWRSNAISGASGVLNFSPTGVNVTAGQNYVAFLSTYYTTGTGSALASSCNVFIGGANCAAANANPSLGRAIIGTASGANLDQITFAQVVNGSQDLTFSATIAPVPEPATWMMMIGGFGMLGTAMRRRPRVSVRYA